MHGNTALLRLLRAFAAGLALWGAGLSLTGAEAIVTRTNWVEHWFTNVIDIRMPDNRFVNVYRTNWIPVLRTNVVDMYATNLITHTLTNVIPVEATWTNYATAYETNWSMRKLTNVVVVRAIQTNVIVACHTNWTQRTLTNHLTVDVLRTNFVDSYSTNLSAVTLTNWHTVVMFQTNWITEPVTNVVRLDAPLRPAVAPPPAETVATVASGSWSGPLVLEAAKTSGPSASHLVEVLLKVRWKANSAAPLQIQSWRIEREDGAVLLFGQDQTFKRQLPLGRYKVEAKLRAEGDDPPVAARGTLVVTTQGATIQQRLLVRR